jgi:CHAT domain-containing protein
VLDDARPLDSGLLLAPAGVGGGPSADGLLQAWEIVEALRLDADLVALSACETALGSDVPGEGIMGLASAFQYAGAQAVLASLWKVSDASTAALMERLYRHLAAGRPAVQALQAAQVELIRGPAGGEDDRTHPFHWAAFQINGAAR